MSMKLDNFKIDFQNLYGQSFYYQLKNKGIKSNKRYVNYAETLYIKSIQLYVSGLITLSDVSKIKIKINKKIISHIKKQNKKP